MRSFIGGSVAGGSVVGRRVVGGRVVGGRVEGIAVRSTVLMVLVAFCACDSSSPKATRELQVSANDGATAESTTESTAVSTVESAVDSTAEPTAKPTAEPTEKTAAESTADAQPDCPPNMLLVEGEYCPGLVQSCLVWVRGGVKRCAQFAESRCIGPSDHRRFCIDRYEYPNLAGVKPAVMVSWYDALRACEFEGKRLCLASEWTLACEGTQRVPYPYGHKRDKTKCNFDQPRISPEPNFLLFAKPRKVWPEVARLDMRIESGAQADCVSPFDVHDMTGNVDEWVLNEGHFDRLETEGAKRPFISGLKGGYWGPIRAACRPMTASHREIFRFYQVGFRCCASARTNPDGVAEQFTSRIDAWREHVGLP